MTKVKRLWMPVLLGALLTGTLVGVAGARPNARPEASPALVDYMFSAFHCCEIEGNVGFAFQPWLECEGTNCGFVCPIKPPHEGVIRVQRLAMYAFDNNSGGEVTISLKQVYPKTKTIVDRLPAPQSTSDSANDPEVYAYNPANFKVSVLQDLVVRAQISGSNVKLYGFKLKYEPL